MASSIEDLVDKLREYGYIRCTFTDLFGVSRGKVLPSTSAAEFLTNGLGFYAGECVKMTLSNFSAQLTEVS